MRDLKYWNATWTWTAIIFLHCWPFFSSQKRPCLKWSRVLRKWPRTAFLCSTDIEEMKCSVTNDNMLKVKNVIFIFQLVLVKMSSIASLVFFCKKKKIFGIFLFHLLACKINLVNFFWLKVINIIIQYTDMKYRIGLNT